MASELVRYQPPQSSIELAPEAWKLAEKIAGTDFVPKALRGKPEAVLACILAGHEAGVSPMQALAKIHVIEGRPAMSAELMRAIVQRAGHELWYDEVSTTRVVACGKRQGTERITRVTWTMDDAKQANLAGKDNWRKFPRAMLTARATGELCRMIFADVLAGISHTIEELEDGFDPIPEADEVVQRAPAPAKATARAKKAATRPAERSIEPAELAPAPAGEVPDLPGDEPAVVPDVHADDDEIVDAEVIDDEPPPPAEDWPAGEWESGDFPSEPPPNDNDRHTLTGPQRIAIRLAELFGIKGATADAREARLVAIGAILNVPTPASSKDLTVDQLRQVLDELNGWAPDRPLVIRKGDQPVAEIYPIGAGATTPTSDSEALPPREEAPEDAPARLAPAPPPSAPRRPEDWTVETWREFLGSRRVKVTALLAEARRQGWPVATLDDLAGSPHANDLAGWCEDQALS